MHTCFFIYYYSGPTHAEKTGMLFFTTQMYAIVMYPLLTHFRWVTLQHVQHNYMCFLSSTN